MKVVVLLIGKNNEKFISEGIEIYASRIKKYCGFEIITIPELKNTKNMPEDEQKIKEGKKIQEFLGKEDYCILLDERGNEYDTVTFARWIERQAVVSTKRLVFVVGGPYGFSDEVYSRSDIKISLSKMTFPHQLVRLLFMEQLYRAFTVIKGEPYHHAGGYKEIRK